MRNLPAKIDVNLPAVTLMQSASLGCSVSNSYCNCKPETLTLLPLGSVTCAVTLTKVGLLSVNFTVGKSITWPWSFAVIVGWLPAKVGATVSVSSKMFTIFVLVAVLIPLALFGPSSFAST